MESIKLKDLVIDESLYLRSGVDPQRVSCFARLYREGQAVDPILVDRRTKKIVDGVHRTRGCSLARGKDGKIEARFKQFNSAAEMHLEAVRINDRHGKTLSRIDQVRAVQIADKLKIGRATIAGALSMTREAVDSMLVRRTAAGENGPVALKRTILHMAGRPLTKRQQEANQRLSGQPAVHHANQLIELLEARLIDWDQERLVDRLRHLAELLEKELAAVK